MTDVLKLLRKILNTDREKCLCGRNIQSKTRYECCICRRGRCYACYAINGDICSKCYKTTYMQ